MKLFQSAKVLRSKLMFLIQAFVSNFNYPRSCKKSITPTLPSTPWEGEGEGEGRTSL